MAGCRNAEMRPSPRGEGHPGVEVLGAGFGWSGWARIAVSSCALSTVWAPSAFTGSAPERPTVKANLVVVEKATRTLALLRDGLVLRRYEVALGRRPWGPKQREGDGRTPEGFYRIDGRNAGSRFHRALRVSYPSREDARRAGEMGRAPGGMIMIHGLPQGLSVRSLGHPWRDWTDGCIAVTNEEIEEIWRLVNDGTPVLIQP